MRKSSYIGEEGLPYHPDAYHQCTVFAGTIVRQVLHIQPWHWILFLLSLMLLRLLVVMFSKEQDVRVYVCMLCCGDCVPPVMGSYWVMPVMVERSLVIIAFLSAHISLTSI